MPSFVKRLGQATGSSSGATTTVTATGAAAKGNRLVVCYCSNNSDLDLAVHTFADSKGNTWTLDQILSAGQITVLIASAPIVTALVIGDTITVTTSVATSRRTMDVLELTDAGAADVAAQAASGGTSASPDSGNTPTRSVPLEVQVGAIGWAASVNTDTFTPSATYTGTDLKVVAGTSSCRYVATMHHAWAVVGADKASGTLSVGRQWVALTVTYPPSAAGGAGGMIDRIPLSSLVNGGLAR